MRRTRLYDPRPEGMKPVSLLQLALNLDQSALINLIFVPATEGAGMSEQGSVLCGASVSDANGYFAFRDPILISLPSVGSIATR